MTVLADVRDALAHADPALVLLALTLYLASIPLVALRWRTVILGVTGQGASLRALVLASLASSFVNNVTPAARVSGEACRVIALVKMRAATTAQAAAIAAYERLTEAPAVALLGLTTLVVFGRLRPSLVVLVAVLVCVGMAFSRTILRWGRRLASRWHQLASISVTSSALAASTALSAGVWLLDVARLRSVAAAFGAPIGPAQAAALAGITIVAGWVPTIGGLGAVEGGLVAGLVSLGVSPTNAVAITIVERAMSYGIATTAGAGALSLLGGRSLWNAARERRPIVEGAAS